MPASYDKRLLCWTGAVSGLSAAGLVVLLLQSRFPTTSEREIQILGWSLVGLGLLLACAGLVGRFWSKPTTPTVELPADQTSEILAQAGLGSWNWDLVSGQVSFSEQWKSQLGYGSGEVLNGQREWEQRFHPEDLEAFRSQLKRTLEKPWPAFQMEYRLRHKDGTYRWILARGLVRFGPGGQPAQFSGSHLDVTEHKLNESAWNGQREILELAARGAGIRQILTALVRLLEAQEPGILGSILLLDSRSKCLRHGAAPSLPEEYIRAIDGAKIGPRAGSCGTAAHRGEFVMVEDIALDPLWEDYRHLALPHGLKACWSTPILDGQSRVLGTFACYSRIPGRPSSRHLKLIEISTQLAALALNLQAQSESLAESEYRMRAVFDSEPECIKVLSEDNVVMEINPAGVAMLEADSVAQVLGTNIASLVTPAFRSPFIEGTRRVFCGEAVVLEYELNGLRGGHRWLERRCSPLRDRAGKIVGALCITRDLSRSKEAETEVVRREQRFKLLIENANDLITVINSAGLIRYQSPSAERVLGYRPEELVGKLIFNYMHPDDVTKVREVVQGLINSAEPPRVEYRIRHLDGSWRVLQSVGRSVPGESPDGFVVVNSRDVTESHSLEAQLRQSQKLEAIGRLAGGIAHDFNNVLTVIQMQADLLRQDQSLPAQHHDSADEISRAAERAANLTRQLLLFSRQQAMQLREIDLNESVTNMTKLLHRILGEQIRMHLNYASRPLMVSADPGMVDQVLLNLAVNARDAMLDGGTLSICTSQVCLDEACAAGLPNARPGDFAVLTVADTGVGIAPEVLPRIFEPFFTTKDIGQGTGLGLATVFGIVQQHQGWISVQSQVGQGTSFSVFLPEVPTKPKQEITVKEVRTELPTGTETILLAEDDPSVRLLVRNILSRLGYRVIEAANGPAALKAFELHRGEVALLLTDLVMPDGVTGRNLAQQLMESSPQLKVVYTSGYSADVAGDDLILKPGRNFLAKPFQAHELALTIRGCLDEPRVELS